MPRNAFYSLLLKELRDLYSAENQIIDALPLLIEASTSPDLKQALQLHFEETKNQIIRLNKIFVILNEDSSGVFCDAMNGILKECRETLYEEYPDFVKDAAIIGAAQCVEHYEISRYGTAKTFAEVLEFDGVAELLHETLCEEGHANKVLTGLAEGGFFTTGINAKANQ